MEASHLAMETSENRHLSQTWGRHLSPAKWGRRGDAFQAAEEPVPRLGDERGPGILAGLSNSIWQERWVGRRGCSRRALWPPRGMFRGN